MKNASGLFAIALIALAGLVSCAPLLSSSSVRNNSNPRIGETGKFWTQNLQTRHYERVDAELLVIGSKCKIWAQQGMGISVNTARNIANTYDNSIYPKMMAAFGSTENFYHNKELVARDTLEFSSWMAKGDGRLTILLLDIQDGYTKGAGSYIAGYFWGNNYFDDPYSNYCDMIYIDIYPGVAGSRESNMTLAHELQHLMNFVTSVSKRPAPNVGGELTKPYQMDTWIDEGLSAAAEYVYAERHNTERIHWFNGDYGSPNQRLLWGDNFYVWGNYANSDPNSILNDYATVYLFFQWLRLQSGGSNAIYKDIINSSYSDYRSVLNAANDHMDTGYSNWGLLLRDWMAANYINASAGTYGYMNDSSLKSVQAMITKGASSDRLSLAPGEGIYTQRTTTSGVATSSNIRLAGLHKSSAQVSDNQIASGGVLLSYNVDTNIRGSSADCYPFPFVETEEPLPYADATFDVSRTSGTARGLSPPPQFPRPYPIGAGDMLRLNGHEEGLPGFDFARLREWVDGNE